MPGKSKKGGGLESKPAYNLKPIPADKQKSLGKLPTEVRNKMGYEMKPGFQMSYKMVNKEGLKMAGNPAYKLDPDLDPEIQARGLFNIDIPNVQSGLKSDNRSIKDIQDTEYRQAQNSFDIVGPLDREIDQTEGTGIGRFKFTDGKKDEPKINTNNNTTTPKKETNTDGGNVNVNYTPKEIKLDTPKFDKVDLVSKSAEKIRAITPRETRRNERNVKFLKRRIRKADRKGEDTSATRQALANAQSQQSGNFLPGDKFKKPESNTSYLTPRQIRKQKKIDKLNSEMNLPANAMNYFNKKKK